MISSSEYNFTMLSHAVLLDEHVANPKNKTKQVSVVNCP